MMANGALGKPRHYVSKKILTLAYYIYYFSFPSSILLSNMGTTNKLYDNQNLYIKELLLYIQFFSELGIVKFCDIVYCHSTQIVPLFSRFGKKLYTLSIIMLME